MLRALLLVCLLLPVASLAPGVDAAAARPGRIVVTVEEIPFGLEKGDWYEGGSVVRIDEAGKFIVVQHPDTNRAKRDLAARPHVKDVESDEPRPMLLDVTPNDPSFASQYHLQRVRAPAAWAVGMATDQASVCIVDTGIRTTHQDLATAYAGGYDFVSDDADPTDDNGHGTHVAGIAAARIGNGLNVAGIANVSVYAAKVLDWQGSGSSSDVASGIIWCADHAGPRTVINLSLGSSSSSPTIETAVAYAIAQGALVVAAAGNDGLAINHPAALADVIAVTCTTSSDALCSFSSRGPDAEIAAPGSGILSTSYTSNTAVTFKSGTSMSAPLVAGAAALYWGLNSAASAADVRSRLAATAEDLGSAGHDPGFGHGRLDVACLLSTALCPPGTADLDVTATLEDGAILTGRPVALTVSVTNDGPDAVPSGSLTGSVPTTLSTAAGLPSDCTRVTVTVTCALGPVASGATRSFTFTLTPTTVTTATVTFAAVSPIPDPTTPNRVVLQVAAVTAKADLRTSQVLSTSSILAGLTVTDNITVTNHGPQDTPAATLRLPIARGVAVTAPVGCTQTTTLLTCPTGPLGTGESTTFSVAMVPALAGAFSIAPSVTGTILDPLTANNRAVSSLSVLRPAANVGVSIVGPAAPAVIGREGTYDVTVTNVGPEHATAVRLTLSLPAVGQWDTAGLPGTCNRIGASVTCALGTMMSGDAVILSLPSTVVRSGIGTLAARVTTTATDAVATNNGGLITLNVPRTTADLAVTAAGPEGGFHIAAASTARFDVTNHGPGNASLAQLTLGLPAGIAWTAPDGCKLVSSITITCQFGVLLAGTTRTIEVTGTPSRAAIGTVTARTTTLSLDPISTNSVAKLAVAVTL